MGGGGRLAEGVRCDLARCLRSWLLVAARCGTDQPSSHRLSAVRSCVRYSGRLAHWMIAQTRPSAPPRASSRHSAHACCCTRRAMLTAAQLTAIATASVAPARCDRGLRPDGRVCTCLLFESKLRAQVLYSACVCVLGPNELRRKIFTNDVCGNPKGILFPQTSIYETSNAFG